LPNPQADPPKEKDAAAAPGDKKEPQKPAPLKGDEAKFQGLWDVTGMESLGSLIPANMMAPTWVKFQGNTYDYMQGEGTNFEIHYKGTFKLNETATPKQVDIHFTERKSKATLPILNAPLEVGIYEWKDDTLKICLGVPKESAPGLPNAGRPVAFNTMPGTGAYTLILKRQKSGTGKPANGQ
jgi:uncharacterized protein (TIGR03067 family)